MSLKYWIVSAFSDCMSGGNPAAVVRIDEWINEQQMQQIAAFFNLSETAFVGPSDETDYQIRWFTPTVEVDLCGHATLAAAQVLQKHGVRGELGLQSRGGCLRLIINDADTHHSGLWLDFPRYSTTLDELPDSLKSLGAQQVFSFDFMGGSQIAVFDHPDQLVMLRATDSVWAEQNGSLVIATAPSAPGSLHDFSSRVFAPKLGIAEDPVTGLAHCALADVWSKRLHKDKLIAYQASERGGLLEVEVGQQRVLLSGPVFEFAEGKLRV